MKNKQLLIWGAAIIAVIGVGFLILSPKGGSVENVDAARMAELVDQGVRVIDVRTPGEYDAGRIPGAENIPVNEVEAASASWDPAQPIAIYCATGSRSVGVVDYLSQQGFAEVYHYDAGIVTWAGEVERGAAAVAAAPVPETSGTPVMYEFFTDW